MKLTVLGCGDAFGSEGRYNTSFLLTHDDRRILIDCGGSTLIRLKQLNIPVTSIDTIVITHFHGDHYGGLPFLFLSNQIEYNRQSPLSIIGPTGIREKVYQLQEALYPGTSAILDSLNLSFIEFQDASWINHEGLSVLARKVTHAPPSNPHGVKIKVGDRTFSFSGDTEWNDSLIDLADESDIFVIECNNFEEDTPGHLSYKTIMQRLPVLNAKRILLTHMGSEVIGQESLALERLHDGMELNF